MNNDIDRTIFYIILNKYLSKNNIDGENMKQLFPSEWYQINNYRLQTEIINEALNKEKKIEETDKYLKYIKTLHK